MESGIKACIVNAFTPQYRNGVYIGDVSNGYSLGQKRLKNSLIHHGFAWDVLLYEGFPNDHFGTAPYNIKAAAMFEAKRQGYTRILWLDCSVWAIKDVHPIFDIINHEGWYFRENGFNCAQTCNDAALEYFGITRDKAEDIPDLSTSEVGVNLSNPLASKFFERWLHSARKGMWDTSREHAGGSEDSRYKFDRQDQSCASVIAGKLGMKLHPNLLYSGYANDKGIYNDERIFVMRGI